MAVAAGAGALAVAGTGSALGGAVSARLYAATTTLPGHEVWEFPANSILAATPGALVCRLLPRPQVPGTFDGVLVFALILLGAFLGTGGRL